MQKQKTLWFWNGYFLLTWWVIWAGFFALPYTVYNAWLTSSIIIIILVWLLVTIMHLILWEICLSLPGHKTFVWMARRLFPHWLAQVALYVNTINNIIWIIAYILLWWTFLHTILLYFWVDINTWWLMFGYVCVVWYFWITSMKQLSKRDSAIVILLFVAIGWIILSWTLRWDMWPATIWGFSENFRVYGITLFALSSINAIPLLYHSTWSSAIKMRKVIITSWMTVTLIALFFSLAIISLSSIHMSEDGIHWLTKAWFPFLGLIWSIAWLCAIFSSHIPVLEHLQEVFTRDIKRNKTITWSFVTLLPFIFILYFDIGIVELLWAAGSMLGWILFILACLLNIYLHHTQQKVRIIPLIKNDQLRSWILCVLCSIGVLYQILALY